MANFVGTNVYYKQEGHETCGCHSSTMRLLGALGMPPQYINLRPVWGRDILETSGGVTISNIGPTMFIGCAADDVKRLGEYGSRRVEAIGPPHFPTSQVYYLGPGPESPLDLVSGKIGHPLPPMEPPTEKPLGPPIPDVLVYEAAGASSSILAHYSLASKGSVLILGMGKTEKNATIHGGNATYTVQEKNKIPKPEFKQAILSAKYFVTSGTNAFIEAIFMNPRLPVWFEWNVTPNLTRLNGPFVNDVRTNGIPSFGGGGEGDKVYSQFKKAKKEDILCMNEQIRFRCMTSHLQFMKYITYNIDNNREITHPITNEKVNIRRYHLENFLSYLKEPYFCKDNIEKLSGFLGALLEDSPGLIVGFDSEFQARLPGRAAGGAAAGGGGAAAAPVSPVMEEGGGVAAARVTHADEIRVESPPPTITHLPQDNGAQRLGILRRFIQWLCSKFSCVSQSSGEAQEVAT